MSAKRLSDKLLENIKITSISVKKKGIPYSTPE